MARQNREPLVAAAPGRGRLEVVLHAERLGERLGLVGHGARHLPHFLQTDDVGRERAQPVDGELHAPFERRLLAPEVERDDLQRGIRARLSRERAHLQDMWRQAVQAGTPSASDAGERHVGGGEAARVAPLTMPMATICASEVRSDGDAERDAPRHRR